MSLIGRIHGAIVAATIAPCIHYVMRAAAESDGSEWQGVVLHCSRCQTNTITLLAPEALHIHTSQPPARRATNCCC